MVKAYLFTESDSFSHLAADLLDKKGIKFYTHNLKEISEVSDDLIMIKPQILIIDVSEINYLILQNIRKLLSLGLNHKNMIVFNDEKWIKLFKSFIKNIHGFVFLKEELDEVSIAIDSVLTEGFYVSKNISRYIMYDTTNDINDINDIDYLYRFDSLNEYDRRIFHQLLENDKLEFIAVLNHFSKKTACKKRQLIYRLFNVWNSMELSQRTKKLGVINIS